MLEKGKWLEISKMNIKLKNQKKERAKKPHKDQRKMMIELTLVQHKNKDTIMD